MKKLFLLALALGFGVCAMAQKTIKLPRAYNKTMQVAKVRHCLKGDEVIPVQAINALVARSGSVRSIGTIIGTTTYDLQTNNSVQHRLVKEGANDLVASWAFASELVFNGWTSRGTGVNHYTSGAWGANPTARIENARTGWGTCVVTNQNEIAVAHSGAGPLTVTSSPIGANTWTSNSIPPPAGASLLWPRVAADGQNVHVIANTDPAGAAYNGLIGCILYYNSHDGGATFSAPIVLPGIDTSNYLGFKGDEYAIDVKGNNVAIVSGNSFRDVFVEISHDGGNTFTKKNVLTFPIKKYDLGPGVLTNPDSSAKIMTTSDGALDVLIDNNGKVHVFFGTITWQDTISESSTSATYFPYTYAEGIAYWNEDMSVPAIIAQAVDLNGDNVFMPAGTGTDKWGYYFSRATSMPNAAIDANGTLYLAYSSVVETTDDGNGLSYRNVYAVKSTDGGHSWTTPTNIDPDDFTEEVFPSVNRNVGTNLQLICQEDGLPGNSLQDPANGGGANPNHPVGVNDIIFLNTPISSLSNAIAVSLNDSLFTSAVTASANPATICSGQSTQLDASTNGIVPASYLWSASSGAFSSTLQNPIVNPSITTTYYVSVTDTTGVTHTSSIMVSVMSNLLVANAGNDQSVCAGTTVTLSATGGTDYIWSNGQNTQSIIVTPATSTNYTVTVSNACAVSSDSVAVIVTPLPMANAGSDTSICSGNSVTLTASGGNIYHWSNGSNTASITISPISTTTYTVTVTNSNNCSNTDKVVVTVNPLPTVNAGVDQSVWAGSSTTLTALGASSYIWNNGVINGTPFTPLATTTYTVTGTNASGCTNTDQVIVIVNPLPTVNAGADVSVCLGSAATFTATGGGTYQWSNGSNTASITVTPAATTTYTVTATYPGATATDNVVVTVMPNPTLDAGANQSICTNTSATLSATGNGSYAWSTGETTYSIIVTPNATATYTITATGNNGCSASDNVVVTVLSNNFLLSFNGNQNPTAPTFPVVFTNSTPNISNYHFTWYFGDGSIDSSNANPVQHNYNNNGIYSVSLLAEKNSTGCTDTLYKYNFITCFGGSNCTHTASIDTSGPINTCAGTIIILKCDTASDYTYQWNLNNIAISGATQNHFAATQSGNYSVTIWQNNCAKTSDIVEVNYYNAPPLPIITSAGIINSCTGGSVTLTASVGYTHYLWSTGATTQSIIVTNSGNYSVQGYDNYNCSSTSWPFNVNASLIQTPEICLVTVDSTTSTYNVILWDKPLTNLIDSFRIYKEFATNQFLHIGSVAYDSLSIYNDYASNPAIHSWRYKISAVDTCGIESALSNPHKTLHLTVNENAGVMNLIWDNYEGLYIPYYYIYRGLSTDALLTRIDSTTTNLFTFTDLNPPIGSVIYRIMIKPSTTCISAKVGVEDGFYSASISNLEQRLISGINTTSIPEFSIMPNPATTEIIIKSSVSEANICISSIEGRTIKTLKMQGYQTKIDIQDLSNGIYFIQLNSSKGNAIKKIVKE